MLGSPYACLPASFFFLFCRWWLIHTSEIKIWSKLGYREKKEYKVVTDFFLTDKFSRGLILLSFFFLKIILVYSGVLAAYMSVEGQIL